MIGPRRKKDGIGDIDVLTHLVRSAVTSRRVLHAIESCSKSDLDRTSVTDESNAKAGG